MRSFPRPSGTQGTYKLNSPQFVSSQNDGGSILEELKLHYETKFLQFPSMKQDPFEKLNLNGHVPAIEDPNTSISLWESGTTVEYLVETYHKQTPLDNSLISIEFHGGRKKQPHAQPEGIYIQVNSPYGPRLLNTEPASG